MTCSIASLFAPPLATAPRAHEQLDALGDMDDNEEDGDEEDEEEDDGGEGSEEAAAEAEAAGEAGAAPKDDAEIDDLTAALGAATV